MTNAGMMMMRRIDDVGRHSGWFIALGVAFIIGGAAAIVLPLIASVAVALTVGWILILVGIVQLVQAWQIRDWGGVVWQTIIGAIILIGGIAAIIEPISAAITLTLLVGIVFIAKGVFQIILGYNMRPLSAWAWVLAAGILAVVAGVIILFNWPFSGTWVLGTLAGVSLIFTGWSYIMMAIGARQMVAM